MSKYNTGDRAYDLDRFLRDTNDLAWKTIIEKEIKYEYPVEPIYPLSWFICYGKAPKQFVDSLLNNRPSKIAKILVDNCDESCMEIVRLIEQAIA